VAEVQSLGFSEDVAVAAVDVSSIVVQVQTLFVLGLFLKTRDRTDHADKFFGDSDPAAMRAVAA
jgi:hypothetical protein